MINRAHAMVAVVFFAALALQAQPPAPPAMSTDDYSKQVAQLAWVHGPATVPLGDQATVRIPKGARYLGPQATSKFLVINGNSPAESAFTIAPEANSWFAILGFSPTGYISDKEKVDPAALFKQLKEGEQAENEERGAHGEKRLFLDRWLVEPHYDGRSHNLEWGTVMHQQGGGNIINYTSRMLGREGVMKAVVVSDPENFQADLAQYRTAIAGFSYQAGKDYQSHQDGDKAAEYGLGALVAGGAAAAAVKTGLLAVLLKFAVAFYKLIAVGALALVATLRGRIGRLFVRRTNTDGEV